MPEKGEASLSNEMQTMRPEHIRLVALRLQGKRWAECAAALGVTHCTVWRWRQDCPDIDALIAQESAEYLVSAKLTLRAALPSAAKAIAELCDDEDPLARQARFAAARFAFEACERGMDPTADPKHAGQTNGARNSVISRDERIRRTDALAKQLASTNGTGTRG